MIQDQEVFGNQYRDDMKMSQEEMKQYKIQLSKLKPGHLVVVLGDRKFKNLGKTYYFITHFKDWYLLWFRYKYRFQLRIINCNKLGIARVK